MASLVDTWCDVLFRASPRFGRATSSTAPPSVIPPYFNEWQDECSFSGHGNGRTTVTHILRFFFIQVGEVPSLHAKMSNNLLLLIFPCSQVLLSSVRECTDVVVSLLMPSGDVESNPVPRSKTDSATDSGARSDLSLVEIISVLQKFKCPFTEL